MKLTFGNSTAIVIGLISVAPQIQGVIQDGLAAFEGCKTLVLPVVTAGGLALSTVVALFSKQIQGPSK